MREGLSSAWVGNPEKQIELGDLFEQLKRPMFAAYWYTQAANQNNKNAALKLEALYKKGEVSEWDLTLELIGGTDWEDDLGDFDIAVDEDKDPKAQFCLANYCRRFLDYPKAFFWCKTAAEQNYVFALLSLGDYYKDGIADVKADFAKAVECYEKAAEQGNLTALERLGEAYCEGENKNFDKAFYWYKKSADAGNLTSLRILGDLYAKGQGVEQNWGKAIEAYERVEKETDSKMAKCIAQYKLGLCYNTFDCPYYNKETAKVWLKKSAEFGHGAAIDLLKEVDL